MAYTDRHTRKQENRQYKCGELRTDIPGLTLTDQIDMYYFYLQQKTQANFRNEGWDVEFYDWLTIWGDKWSKRGRRPGQFCMSRIDNEKPWTKDNIVIWAREELISKLTTERNTERGLRGPKKTIEERRQAQREYYWRKKAEAELEAKAKGDNK